MVAANVGKHRDAAHPVLHDKPAYLLPGTRACADRRGPVAVPARYAAPGYYPTEYRVYWNAGAKEYRVALSGLLRRG
jgi:hypothetical protein